MESWLTGHEGGKEDLEQGVARGNVRKRGSRVSLLAEFRKRLVSAGAYAFVL